MRPSRYGRAKARAFELHGEERRRPRRRASEKETELLKGYSRNGVVGRVRDGDGHTFWSEYGGPPLPLAADDDGTYGSNSTRRDATTGTSSTPLVAETVDVKQEPRDAITESGETATLRIENFRRPFTLSAVQAFVQQCGPMEDGGFWMDAIKTHCYVTFASVDVARKLKTVIDGTVWPAETGLTLSVTYSNVTAMEVIVNGPPAADSARDVLKRKASDELLPRSRVIRGRGAPASIDSLFSKTETKPMLYYLPVPESEVTLRKQERERKLQCQRDCVTKGEP